MKLNYTMTKEVNERSSEILKNLRIISGIIILFWAVILILIQCDVMYATYSGSTIIAILLFSALCITGWIYIIEKTQVAGIVNMIVSFFILFTLVPVFCFYTEAYNGVDGTLLIYFGGWVYNISNMADVWQLYRVISMGLVSLVLMLGGFKFISEVILKYGKEDLS